jgi:hypothetical protein
MPCYDTVLSPRIQHKNSCKARITSVCSYYSNSIFGGRLPPAGEKGCRATAPTALHNGCAVAALARYPLARAALLREGRRPKGREVPPTTAKSVPSPRVLKDERRSRS